MNAACAVDVTESLWGCDSNADCGNGYACDTDKKTLRVA